MNPISCNQVETLLCDYVDELLTPGEVAALEAHLHSCSSCMETVADIRLAMKYAQEAGAVDVPVGLINRILEQTSGQTPAGVPKWRHRFTGWWDRAVSPLIRPALEPRFALSMAMTVISFSMLARMAGLDVSRIEMSDLQPARIIKKVGVGVHKAGSAATNYYENLRVVYEIQSQLQILREDQQQRQDDRKAPAAPKDDKNKKDDKKGSSSSLKRDSGSERAATVRERSLGKV